jgi:hypothetical protein
MTEFNLYFDESGTHAGSPVLIMGGLLGNAEQFSIFRQRLDEIRLHYEFDVFHAVEMKGGRKDFQAWTYEKQLALVVAFDKLIGETLTAAAASSIDKVNYKKFYFDDLQFPEVPKDSAYGLCFRMCLVAFLEKIEAMHGYSLDPYVVNVTIEHGDPNWKDAERIFGETKALASVLFGVDPLGTFRTATKQECPELMLADFMAYTSYLICNNDFEQVTLSDEEMIALGLPVPGHDARRSKLMWISFEPADLQRLSAHLAELRRRQHEVKGN